MIYGDRAGSAILCHENNSADNEHCVTGPSDIIIADITCQTILKKNNFTCLT